uniref:Amyloid beta precursor protein binding family B member 3 n=1 Tax=Pavo cristatus TaxID=9049 RepID=A0A8C9ERU9_PAVCR
IKIHDSLGTYYWHVPTGTTQWQHPARSTSPGGCVEADGEEMLQETVWDVGREGRGVSPPQPSCQAVHELRLLSQKGGLLRVPLQTYTLLTTPLLSQDCQASVVKRTSKCFAVRSLGWVEIPEEDLAPGKSSIAVNNCIQQLSNSQGRGSADNWGEGQDLVMILKKDTMSLVDPLDHSLIHCQPILNIRVWGVGCNKGRDFAFVASDKDTCVLKCHVFRCNVPAKGIAKALHGMCSQVRSALSCGALSSAGLCPGPWVRPPRRAPPRPAAGGEHRAPLPAGMDVLNAAIEQLLAGPGRHSWTPAHVYVSDTAVRVRRAQVGPGRVRYVTFLGVGRDAHTFALIADTGRRFQCAAFWCEPDAGTISEAVQAACMVSGAARGDGEADREPSAATPPASPQVQYQKCLVAAAPGPKAKRAAAGGAKAGGGSGGAAGPGPRKRGVLSLLEAFRQRHALLHLP